MQKQETNRQTVGGKLEQREGKRGRGIEWETGRQRQTDRKLREQSKRERE